MDDFLNGRQTLGDFLAGFDIDINDVPADTVTELSRCDLSYESIEAWCQVGYHFGKSQRATPIIAALLRRDDHEGHEALADALQDLRNPQTVECLLDRINRRLPYLVYNDDFALAYKCVWALHDIGTPAAITALTEICQDPREDIAEKAVERLDALRDRHSDDPKEPYRMARDGHLGPL